MFVGPTGHRQNNAVATARPSRAVDCATRVLGFPVRPDYKRVVYIAPIVPAKRSDPSSGWPPKRSAPSSMSA
jgi:hypothetical protein